MWRFAAIVPVACGTFTILEADGARVCFLPHRSCRWVFQIAGADVLVSAPCHFDVACSLDEVTGWAWTYGITLNQPPISPPKQAGFMPSFERSPSEHTSMGLESTLRVTTQLQLLWQSRIFDFGILTTFAEAFYEAKKESREDSVFFYIL